MQFEVDSFQGHGLDASQLVNAPNTSVLFLQCARASYTL